MKEGRKEGRKEGGNKQTNERINERKNEWINKKAKLKFNLSLIVRYLALQEPYVIQIIYPKCIFLIIFIITCKCVIISVVFTGIIFFFQITTNLVMHCFILAH